MDKNIMLAIAGVGAAVAAIYYKMKMAPTVPEYQDPSSSLYIQPSLIAENKKIIAKKKQQDIDRKQAYAVNKANSVTYVKESAGTTETQRQTTTHQHAIEEKKTAATGKTSSGSSKNIQRSRRV